MSILSNIASKFRSGDESATKTAEIRPYRRSFKGAVLSSLTRDWPSTPQGINGLLGSGGITLRTRARWLVKNDPYAKKYVRMMRNGVIGPKGLTLQAKVKNRRGDKLNAQFNKQFESAFATWSQPKYCTVRKQLSFQSLCRFLVSQLPGDGEFFVQRVIDSKSPFGLRLRLIDPDQLDMGYNVQRLTNGNMILMGVELDQDFTPQAYWFWDKNPYDMFQLNRARKRVPASEVIHYFSPWFTNQVRGIPEMASAMWRMNMLDGYEEAELTAARVGAAKMGFLQPKDGDPNEYKGEADPIDKEGILTEATPGAMEILPKNWDFKSFDPQHPNAVFPQFIKGCLRGIAAGWGVGYNGLANDLEGVNFSSIRAGLLEERDEWKIQQSDFIDGFISRVAEWWVEAASLAGAINLGQYTPEEVAMALVWNPRRWPWVDPLKDVQASVLARQNGLTTMTESLAEEGKDFEETVDILAEEQAYLKEKGVVLGTDVKGDATAPEDEPDGDDSGGSGKSKGAS